MRQLASVGFIAIGMLLWAGGGSAQPNLRPEPDEILEDFMASPHYRAFLEKTVNAIEPEPLRASCQHMILAGPVNSYIPLVKAEATGTAPNKRLSKGAWISSVEFDRCGIKTKRRTLMQIDSQGGIIPFRLLPGEFRGNPILERDTIQIVFPALMASAGCRDSKQVYVSEIAIRETETGYSWTETWSAVACGSPVTLDVNYSTKNDGTTVSTQVRKPL